jgi:hypothetical protein
MPIRVVLIAEDDEEQIESWKRDIKEFNRDGKCGFTYEAHFVKSRKSALQALDRMRINCAVVDLRLPEQDEGTSRTEPVGNDVLQHLLLDIGVPAVVYSAHTAEASNEVKNSQIRLIDKQRDGARKALDWLATHEGLMAAMEIAQKKIAEESAKLFSQSIWPRWQSSLQDIKDGGALTEVITRQTAAHVAERLALPPNNFHHPEEFYLVPPLSTDRLDTGDLMTVDGEVYVVVTPRCNLACNYPKHLMLALCKNMDAIWTGLRGRFADEKKREKAAVELRSYATQGHATSTHFLPPCGAKGPWLVDFREIRTIPAAQVPDLLEARFASVAPQFVPNLVQRYAAYLGRIGQPDLDVEILKSHVCK